MVFKSGMSVRCWALAGAAVAAISSPAYAQAAKPFDIPAQPLGSALEAFGRQSGMEILFDRGQVAGKTSAAVKGSLAPAEALSRLLAGSGLSVRRANAGTFVVSVGPPGQGALATPQGPGDADVAQLSELTVTGSRIRGAPPASPVIAITQEEMRNAGQNNLGDVASALPQSFGGGQNPGVANGAAGGINVNSASTLNLRGLGPDATLTLLNGRRLAYNAVNQAIDISAVPLAAVAKLEVVVDGASALYGSDAVAGVANVILKRDFDGLSTAARYGFSTDGGNERQQYELVAGRTWGTGGLIVALDHEDSTPIRAEDRSYGGRVHPTTTFLPAIRASLGLLSGHQTIRDGLEFEVDALVGERSSSREQPNQTVQSYLFNGSLLHSRIRSFAISPRVNVDLPAGWKGSVSTVYGRHATTLDTQAFLNYALTTVTPVRYRNTLALAETSGEGSLAALPAGEIRLAIGAGYRRNSLDADMRSISVSGVTNVSRDYTRHSDSQYAYGELFIPIVSPTQDVAGIHRAFLTGALRYEDYGRAGSIATPKVGAVYEPTSELSLKISWGRSFKAPTLDQLNSGAAPYLYPSDFFSTPTYPSGSQVLFLSGSNPNLTPEKAETLTATIGFRPEWLPGAEIEVSYFRISYRDRVVVPLTLAGALENPLYASFVTQRPSAATVTATIAALDRPLLNATPRPFDPANVVAIVDARLSNANRQLAEGVDVAGRYSFDVGRDGRLTATTNISYLRSTQRLEAGGGEIDLAGNIFNPPHWRGRVGLSWMSGPLTLSSYAAYTGGVWDNRLKPVVKVGSMTTLDATGRFRFETDGGFAKGLELTVSVLNIFNAKPAVIRTLAAYFPPYDSTNYSTIGRYVSIGVEKRW